MHSSDKLEAGNQYLASMPVFEIVSRSFSIIDGDVQFGRNNGRGYFWDSKKLYQRKVREMEIVFRNDPESFRQTNEVASHITDLETLKASSYNKIRRQYFLADMNLKATELKKHMVDNTSEIYLNQILKNSELAPLKDLLLQ